MLDLRFIHASDFHLEQPLYGMAEAPDHLRELLVDAPYRAAAAAFEAAMTENVDFIILSGDIVHVEGAGPRAISFLIEQFSRLNEAGISVYWVGGQVDAPDRWPSAIALPPNVHLFSSHEVEELVHYRGEEPAASISGQSWHADRKFRPTDFKPEHPNLFNIVAYYGRAETDGLSKMPIHYWALGGRHDRKKLAIAPRTAYYPGTHQGRSPAEDGPHGCLLVQTDRTGQIRIKNIPVDVIRWRIEKITLDPRANLADARRLIRQRLQSVLSDAGGAAHLFCFELEGGAWLGSQAREGSTVDQLVAELRSEYGHRSPAAWTVAVEMAAPAGFPSAWYEEDTIMGDFLRAVHELQQPGAEMPELESLLDMEGEAAALTSAVMVTDAATQQRILREAAALAVEMLGGGSREEETSASS
ncbi:metallophosphoesterase family protein [Lignipirellula cremea]|uniref:Putative metallophosphoesterase YhaO n=1 Tax=Lignipirellula cremea TaxID=2528010 RepID=A0A518DSV0_9BACT|nr:metallophosphoesterase [Lignipirellula cremea]QDU94878.1 putative metallophosphoesterase YhaO [Lignipirellula cremea]